MSSLESVISSLLPSTGNKKLAMTNVDSWLGCCIAVDLAENLQKKCPDVHLIALACKDNPHADLDKLKKYKNVHIHKVDYNDEKSLEKVLHGCDCTILIPEMTENRVKHAKNTLCAMKANDIKGCLMLSCAGTDQDHGLKEIRTFHEVEKAVEEACECYMILRKTILNQCFLLWSPIVKEKSEFLMSCTAQCQMAPIDACDVISAITTIIVDHCRDGDKRGHRGGDDTDNVDDESGDDHYNFGGDHKNKKYALTGPNKLTAQDFVQALNEATGQRVQFKEVSRDELKKYFESLKKCEGRSEDLSVDRYHEILAPQVAIEVDDDEDDIVHDGDHHMAPTESMINLLLDELELIKKGEAGFVSGDLEKIIGHQGKTVKDFFQKYKDDFRGRRA
ncbi:hypothetical protein BGX23_002589 [Mortierella sp. AD031]|nr:hypothetical protein BGX23_002589 [Mortierella sp. AD031]